jgi:hypothetical protein
MDRSQEIRRLAKEFGFDPLHPALVQKRERGFQESFELGRVTEKLAQTLLAEAFPNYRIVPHCDTTIECRKGKRTHESSGNQIVLPDFEFVAPGGYRFYLDVKGKDYHSFYRRERDIQQFVDLDYLRHYQDIAEFEGTVCFILIHLFPAELMGEWGKNPLARIHSGIGGKNLLPDEQLQWLVTKYPVDDHYYLTSAKHFLEEGRPNENRGKQGMYLSMKHIAKAPQKSQLPLPTDFDRIRQEALALQNTKISA